MKNKTFIYILFSAAMALQASAQHENCDHGDAPDASANAGISNFVRVDKMSMEAINLKTAAAEPRKIRSTSKIVEWWEKKRAKRTKNVLQCPMC